MLNCRQTYGPRERGRGPHGWMGTDGDQTHRQTHRQYPLGRTARHWPTDACASQLLALIPASCQLSKSSAPGAPHCTRSWNGEAAPRHAASPARTRHRQPSTPRARVLASGPCRVRCNRMPVAIRNEQLRPVSEPPRHRLARSQAAQRSVARRRRMLPAIVRAHPLPCAAGIGLAIGAGHCRGAILSPGNATVPFTPLAPARRTDLHRQRQSPTNEQAMRSRAPLQPFFYRFCLFLRRKKSEEASRIFVLSFTPLLGARCPPPGWRRCVGSASCCGTTMIT